VFINRFGRQEAGGRGLRDEIAAAIEADVPLVIAVHKSLQPEWEAFAGSDCAYIAADPKQIEMWCLDWAERAVSAVGSIDRA
jgi:hypothetical protein